MIKAVTVLFQDQLEAMFKVCMMNTLHSQKHDLAASGLLTICRTFFSKNSPIQLEATLTATNQNAGQLSRNCGKSVIIAMN